MSIDSSGAADKEGAIGPSTPSSSDAGNSQNSKATAPGRPSNDSVSSTSTKRVKKSEIDSAALNKYSIYPTTVPPFVLDSQLDKVRLKDNGIGPNDKIVNDDARFNLRDPFLVNYGGKWEKFASNIGSNVAYCRQQQVNLAQDESSTDSSNVDIEKQENSSDVERKRFKQEILTDLDEEWGGGKRLNELFNTPIVGNFEFKNNEDRKAWLDYVSKVKQFYYLKNADKRSLEEIGAITSRSGKHHHPDWWEEFNKDKKKLSRLKQRKIQQWTPGINHLLIDNQYFVLTLRICSGILSIISLGLAIRIFVDSNEVISRITMDVGQQPSTIMAICVNTIAVVYIVYIAHDEFSGKPLGLRNPYGKLRLILLDLLFIIFCSANLALAFNTLFDKRWVCTVDGRSDSSSSVLSSVGGICEKQRALSAFLFLMLVMWVTTFSISIIRVIQKMATQSPRD